MWGLDAADPAIAIAVMQAKNASSANAVFAPALFGTPVVLSLVALVAWLGGCKGSAKAFLAAGLVYSFGGLGATMAVNVLMNEALALVAIPDGDAAEQRIWTDYSAKWQVWNIARTVASGIAVALIGAAFPRLNAIRP
jgi:uncharacterized membrane protein